jgi:hypothetical protein
MASSKDILGISLSLTSWTKNFCNRLYVAIFNTTLRVVTLFLRGFATALPNVENVFDVLNAN